jgi:hypothetical protein
LKFYTDKSNSAPDKVWQNLTQHEIGKDLLPCPKKELTYENDVNVVRDQTELPRYLISSSAETLDFLFNLEQKLDSSSTQANKAKEAVWKLVTSLKTNPHIYLRMLRNQDIGQMLSADQPMHKLLYVLQILQSFVNSYSRFGNDSANQVRLRCYFDAKKAPKWNGDEQFPSMQEASAQKSEKKQSQFGTL